MIYYKGWIKVIAITFNLISSISFDSELTVESKWIPISSVGFYGGNNQEALQLDFISTERNEPIKTYIFIPWGDFTVEKQNNMEASLDKHLRLVTPFAVIYEKVYPLNLTDRESQISQLIDYRLEDIFFEYVCDEIMYGRDSYTLSPGVQVMERNDYSYYVELHVAGPGSHNIDLDTLKKEFSGKMLQLNIFPDQGQSRTMWLNCGEPEDFRDIQGDLEQINNRLVDFLYDTTYSMDKLKSESLEILKKSENKYNKLSRSQLKYFINELLTIKKYEWIVYDEEDIFPDYEPKTSPDTMLDYMPSLVEQIRNLPQAKIESLPKLIEQFFAFKTLAESSPGEWVDGSIPLGAREREYEPSAWELLLDETGSRIKSVVSVSSEKEIRDVLKGKKYTLEYRHFTFIHLDVMGSGRFFYVDEIIDKTIGIK